MCAGKSFTTYTDANSCGCWVCETTFQEKWRRNASCFLRLSARNPATARWGALDCKRKLGIPGTRLAIRVSPNAALSQVKRLSALCSRLCRTGTTWNKQLRMQCMQDCIHLHCFQVLMKGCTLCAHLDSPLLILSFHQLYQVISYIQGTFFLLVQRLELAHWFQASGKLHSQSLHDAVAEGCPQIVTRQGANATSQVESNCQTLSGVLPTKSGQLHLHLASESHTCLRCKNFWTQWGDCSSLFHSELDLKQMSLSTVCWNSISHLYWLYWSVSSPACSWFHLTSNTIGFSGFLAVTPGRQVGC